jgi:hypothetical protein
MGRVGRAYISRAERWAPLAAMVLWTLQKLMPAVVGLQGAAHRGFLSRGPHGGELVVQLLWWCIFMHVFNRAFRVEQERRTR